MNDNYTPYGDPDWGTDGRIRTGKSNREMCGWRKRKNNLWYPSCRMDVSGLRFHPSFDEDGRGFCQFCGDIAYDFDGKDM